MDRVVSQCQGLIVDVGHGVDPAMSDHLSKIIYRLLLIISQNYFSDQFKILFEFSSHL